ncbi:putative F-box protein At1g47790 [Cornus florida]|uniref:putative F-box protein At1g47790 n=1 Tax=Cornus florida TaxID=4283 RepID=UPI0028A27EC1|nr:putative F-box protein At1g47790 [Cornus florida]
MKEKMLDANKEKMFSSLVPDNSAKALCRFTEMVDDLIRTQAEKLQQNNVVSLPQEIIFEILKEIPAKILFRFRSVSKLWLSIIDDPLFVESHHNRSINRPGGINLLFVKSPTYEVDNQFYSTDPEGRSVLHLQSLESLPVTAEFLPSPLYSVKGLICFQRCIWNPSTREIHEIPLIMIRSPIFVSTGDDSLRVVSFNLLGFDSAASGGKHKVLNITEVYNSEDDETTHTQFKVLTLSQGGAASTWRDIDIDQSSVNSQLDRFSHEINRGCCINGIIYCLGNIGSSGKYVILAFQVGDESFKIMPLPHGAARDCFFARQVRDRLALINSKVTEIWILEDYDKQLWNKQTLNVPPMFFEEENPIEPICGSGVEILFQYHNSKFFYYNLETERTRNVPNL